MVIAIDGPAGAGKGTITTKVAEKLGLVTIDTGAMYRCVALNVLRNNIDLEDTSKIVELTKNLKIKFDENKNVYLNGEDVTKEIRSMEVSNIVSIVSKIVDVRKIMVEQQRKFAINNNIIMEGRDITTVVFPDADYKFYLDASCEERARRRYNQNKEEGLDTSYEEIIENIRQRDYNDTHKEVGALKRTNDQIYIDSTDLTIDEVVNFIIEKVGEVK